MTTSHHSQRQRRRRCPLRLNGAFVLTDATVHDARADRLTGSSGRDWFFANRDQGIRDTVTDAHENEDID